MPSHDGYKCRDLLEQDSFLKRTNEYRDHPSIKFINTKNNSQIFRFRQQSPQIVSKPWSEKCLLKNDIKINLLRKNAEFFAKYTCSDINDSICCSEILNELKK